MSGSSVLCLHSILYIGVDDLSELSWWIQAQRPAAVAFTLELRKIETLSWGQANRCVRFLGKWGARSFGFENPLES